MGRFRLFLATLCAAIFRANAALAETVPAPVSPEQAVLNPFGFERPERTTGSIELGLAWLSLPTAEVCERSACLSGDTTPLVELWNIVRFDRRFAVGAGVGLGLIATTQPPRSNPREFARNHTRSYFTIEGVGRYYPEVFAFADLWIGGGIGLVVMSDTFDTAGNLDVFAPIGSPGVTIKSEGLSTFGALGLSQNFAEHWLGGVAARAGAYHFSDTAERSPLGDVASIAGTNFFFSAGLYIGLEADL